MKVKEIKNGDDYLLYSSKKSTTGCSDMYFKLFRNQKVTVVQKLNNFNAKNNVLIMGFDYDKLEYIQFWCSAYDLKELNDKAK